MAQVLVLLLLVAGLGAGLALSQRSQVFTPKAQQPTRVYVTPENLSFCDSRISDFTVDEPCDEVEDGFRSVRFSCEGEVILPDLNPAEDRMTTCKSIDDWVSFAKSACSELCSLPSPPPTPTSSSFPIPTPEPPSVCRTSDDCKEGSSCVQKCPVICDQEGFCVSSNQCPPGVCVNVPRPSFTPSPLIIKSPPPTSLPVPVPSIAPQPIFPPFSYYCPVTGNWVYPWQSCP